MHAGQKILDRVRFGADVLARPGLDADMLKVDEARRSTDTSGYYIVDHLSAIFATPSDDCVCTSRGIRARTRSRTIGGAPCGHENQHRLAERTGKSIENRSTLMMHKSMFTTLAALIASTSAYAAGDVARGAQAFRACAACHSLAPGEHRTGPSLAAIYGRRVSSAAGFHRYSEALRKADLVWDEKSLDEWLRDPAAFIPGNAMAYRGLSDARARGDVIAYLRAVSAGKAAAPATPALPDLKAVKAGQRVKTIRHCADAYRVTLADGKTYPFWEFNLRFKTDSSGQGPRKGEPVIVGAGMGGDRAQVVFAAPEEISAFIRDDCQ